LKNLGNHRKGRIKRQVGYCKEIPGNIFRLDWFSSSY